MKAYKNNDHEARICVLETITAQISETLIRLEKKTDSIREDFEKQFDKIDKKFEKLDDKITEIRKENTSHFRTTIFTLLTLIGTPLFMESLKLLTKFVHGS